MSDIVIAGAKRTAVGSFLGALGTLPAHELGRVAIEAALAQSGVTPDQVDEVILGHVLTAALGRTRRGRPPLQRAFHRRVRRTGGDDVVV